MPGFQKLAQAGGGGGAESASLLTSLSFIRTKPNYVLAKTILWKVIVQNFKYLVKK